MSVAIMFFAGFLCGMWAYRKHVRHPNYFSEKLSKLLKRVG